MEMIYGDEFLSPGGLEKTKALTDLALIEPQSQVLDVGCGIGGTAFHLAQQYSCSVQGVDLMPHSVAEANRRAETKGFQDQVQFVTADATNLPYPEEHFDVVWGQDAWLHVDNKDEMLAEFHRVLRNQGQLVFSDWLISDPTHKDADSLFEVAAAPNMASVGQYQSLLVDAGFEVQTSNDTSAELVVEYEDVLDRLTASQGEIVERFSQRVFDIVHGKQKSLLDACHAGLLVTNAFVALRQ